MITCMPSGRVSVIFVSPNQRFGRLTVIDPEIRVAGNKRGARLRCDCGEITTAQLSHLVRGRSQSCGCLYRERARIMGLANREHGLTQHRLFGTWAQMVARCEHPQKSDYRYYGGRGITVCERWHDVRLFVEDIERDLGPRPEGF